MRLASLSFLFLFVFGSFSNAFEVPTNTGPVVDQVGLLRPSTVTSLKNDLFQFKQSTGTEIQIFITKSLNDEAIESVAIQIFDKWKLGSQKKDNGILFLVAPTERKLRIEVGQGLEGNVPDLIAKRIISDVVRPSFAQGEFEVGIVKGVLALKSYILSGDAPPEPAPGGEKVPASYFLFGLGGLFLIVFLFSPALALQILFSVLSGGRGGFGGRGGGGGSWSGGGGSSSGGGASGNW